MAFANPADGTVVGGSAAINSSGSTLTVNQSTSKAIIDWRGFDIGAGETTQFNQPSASAVTLNRVTSGGASRIDGALKANGNVIIVNQNGVVFGNGSTVDVNSLVATTSDIRNDDFMAGNLKFTQPGNPTATIENRGTITAKEAGLVGLVAPNVINSGTINARLGRVQLASGDTTTVDLYGDGLMEVGVSDAVTSQLVSNSGIIRAEGGTIALTAAAGATMVNNLIHVSGELRAPAVGMRNGKIVIYAAGSNAVSGNVAADKGKKSGYSTVIVENAILD
ncbi:MAG: filamentous hemagglutinin N-terminal domain-containing protein, partial [Rickettsiales bacterium]|nr:filamentous hemagglutinin N-terminal domain-containing protein [Rickettsiales bacterium]